ncbi:MAG: hypothetical protein ACI8UO_001021 [Verrucomicrobiales bacterium]|jgi:hypothetical protein
MVVIFEEIDLSFPIENIQLPPMLDEFRQRMIDRVLPGLELTKALCFIHQMGIDL